MSVEGRSDLPQAADTEGALPAGDGWILILLCLLAAGSLVPVWTVPVLPLQDLPNHLLKIDIFQRILHGEAQASAVYALNLGLLANYACYVAILALSPWLGTMGAAKVFVSFILAGLPVAAYLFLRRANPGHTYFALAAPTLGFNLFLMMGNLNFCFALAVYLLCLAALEAPHATPQRLPVAFTLLATLLYFSHGFVFLTLAGVTGCLLLLDFSTALLRRSLGLVPGLLCLAATLIEALLSGPGAPGALHPAFSGPGTDSIRVALVWLINPHGRGYDTYLALGWVSVMAAGASWALGNAAGEARRRPGSARNLIRANRWLVIGALLGVAYFVAPDQLRDWWHLRMRFSPLCALTLLGGLKAPSGKWFRAGMAALLVVAALAVQTRNGQEFRRRSADVQEYLGGIDAVEEGSSLLPVENLEPGPKYRVNLHAWGYYAMAKGGWAPYLHAQPAYNPVIYRVTPWGPGEGMPVPPDGTLRRVAACYDYVILWNPREGDARALRPYFELVRSSRRLRIWRNRAGLRKAPPSAVPACVMDFSGKPPA